MVTISIIFEGKQLKTLKDANKWFKKQNKQVYTIAGYAGTGKSTIVNALTEQIGVANNTRYATFTGKASLVLNRMGNSAETLHRLMYIIEEDLSYAGYTKLVFSKRKYLDSNIQLIVVDEVSMVNKKLMDDLKSFGIPILCLGDPGQLDPVGGVRNSYISNPDAFLDEIHRQAKGDPIIYISMLAREGKNVDIGKYGKNVLVMNKDDISDSALRRLGTGKNSQILCGYNKTRTSLNGHIRKLLGNDHSILVKGDKIICTRNNWKEVVEGTPLINGTTGVVENYRDFDEDINRLILDFKPDYSEGGYFENLEVDTQEFMNIPKPKVERNDYNKFDYGNVITTHKSQGSQFEDVLLFEEVLMPETHNKWFYTGITRASKTLVIAKQQKRYW